MPGGLNCFKPMQIQELVAEYAALDTLAQIRALLDKPHQDVCLKGAAGSLPAMLCAALHQSSDYNHLIVLNDKEEAAYFQNDLSALLPGKDVLFFPDSYKRPQFFEEINNNQVMQRTEVVNRLHHPGSKKQMAVTYPEALFERVVDTRELDSQSLRLKTGDPLDLDFTIDLLVDLHFERVDFVYEPGQFSLRGGILDIFSYGNEYPYRIELLGDQIESLRTFDPTDQLSVKKIASVSIVPNLQTFFQKEKKGAVWQVFPENTLVWVKDIAHLQEVMERCMERARKYKEEMRHHNPMGDQHPMAEASPEEVYLSAGQFMDGIRKFRLLEFGGKSFYGGAGVEWPSRPQPSFNKQFDLLIRDLQERQKNGYRICIFSSNPKQIERFYAIFEDLRAELPFQPVYVSLHEGFVDERLKICCFTDHQIFNRYHRYQMKQGFSRNEAMMMRNLKELKPGDFVTHIDHGVGVYSGLERIEVNGQWQESVRLKYAGNDILYVGIQSLHKISKYVGKEGTEPRVNKLGTDTWANLKKKTKKKIKEIAFDLIRLYAERKARRGFQFQPDTYLQTELEASFMYEDTPDQAKATADVKRDMEALSPMDRLVCGDVGFGKTEVAVRAAFKAATDGKQVAVLVPTTILALQHYKTFSERLADFPVTVDYVNRFKSAKEKSKTLKELEEGKINIIIGTHGLVGNGVKFKDLGLIVVDEEQKFGVGVKEKLKTLRTEVDTLTLTATPIPRTLQFSLMGARDLSIINTPPPNRQPIQTEVHPLNPDIIREAIEQEVFRGGQVFFVHNRVKDIADVKRMLQQMVPDVSIAVAHGQMGGEELEQVLIDFIQRRFEVLLCTNIIEAGIDIPNANTIIINNAHQFGLSDLHQLRGRVGRSNRHAFCYLLSPPSSTLTQEARQRLQTIEDFSELGSGFNVAMRDLDIRGAGNLLGAEQSGFIAEIGYDVYHKILDEAIRELKDSSFRELYKEELDRSGAYVSECTLETDLEMLIPDQYVSQVAERMSLYRNLNEIKTEEQLSAFSKQLSDRFGKIPRQIYDLFDGLRLKWVAVQLGMEKVVLNKRHLRCYFPENQQSVFYSSDLFARILEMMRTQRKGIYLRQTEKHLILHADGIGSMHTAMQQLSEWQRLIRGNAGADKTEINQ